MKKFATASQLGILCMAALVSSHGLAQVVTAVPCDQMSLVVNVGSNPSSINLYHPGGYLTWPPSENVMSWEFTDSEGNVLYEEVLVNNNFVSFSFELPLTDTMFVSVLLTNDSAMLNGSPVACLIEDYLFWEETEIIPGTFLGSWTLGGSLGVDANGASDCVDESLIDPDVFCTEIYDPVCGCDGVTYSNSCFATYAGGVTSWEAGPCVVVEYGGCTYPLACNYDPDAAFDDGTCTFPPYDCALQEGGGCIYPEAVNYDPDALFDDGSCDILVDEPCPGDLDGDGSISVADILQLLTAFGASCN
ncbi:MAG: hypothetical protein O3B70_09915 [Bacteroidetes bacterium]|nr:hypothetical protein [Bacteroidota bacterium]MDA0904637.1 hypothetical protein [Bacteroidota bacterium]MDA1243326.1 hypothetical protein [Bacteroidota bacterium]